MGACSLFRENGSWCNREKIVDYDGVDYCVFHAPKDKKVVNEEEFYNLIVEKLEDRRYDFRGTIFEWDIDFNDIVLKKDFDNIILERCCFFGKVKFPEGKNIRTGIINDTTFFNSVDFSKCHLEHMLLSNAAKFRNDKGSSINFDEATISYCTADTFQGVTFSVPVSFKDTKFTDSGNNLLTPNFKDTIFESDVDFSGVTFTEAMKFFPENFKGDIRCTKATFEDNVFFKDINFSSKDSFKGTHFKHYITFNDVYFTEMANFYQSIFYRNGEFVSTKGKGFTGAGGDFRYVGVLEGGKLKFDNLDLTGFRFLDTDIRKIDFINHRWEESKYGRRFFLSDEHYIDLETDSDKRLNIIHKIEKLYAQLKEKSIAEHNWRKVSNWHYCEKEMTLKIERSWRTAPKWLFLRAYKFLSGYNEVPLQAIFVLAIMLIISTLSFVNGLDAIEFLPFINTVDSVEYKVNCWARPFAMFMQTLVAIQIALVVMSVRNKLRR